MHLNELKSKNPSDLLSYAESLDVENASNLRKQDMMFACLKISRQRRFNLWRRSLEVLADGFGFLRSVDSNYLAGPDDIYVSPSQIKNLVWELEIQLKGNKITKRWRKVFCLIKKELLTLKNQIIKQRINFDNLTPLSKWKNKLWNRV